ncbi:hypothetical protein GCM10025861_24600 [Methanobacterium petrolearium]|nr:hypothetical protein GCM10025861_24600 [Methanobacterium petrolearium]
MVNVTVTITNTSIPSEWLTESLILLLIILVNMLLIMWLIKKAKKEIK